MKRWQGSHRRIKRYERERLREESWTNPPWCTYWCWLCEGRGNTVPQWGVAAPLYEPSMPRVDARLWNFCSAILVPPFDIMDAQNVKYVRLYFETCSKHVERNSNVVPAELVEGSLNMSPILSRGVRWKKLQFGVPKIVTTRRPLFFRLLGNYTEKTIFLFSFKWIWSWW